MRVIILRDNKGFQKMEEVYIFPPVYSVAEFPPISVGMKIPDNSMSGVTKIDFYPKGEPTKDEYGNWFQVYKQQ